jgi:hypothetical protein
VKIFEHTHREKNMWRGWLKDGQVLELVRDRHEWAFGAGMLVHSDDDDRGRRMLCLKFWRFAAYIPMGITRREVDINREPQWSIFGSQEFGLWLRWGHWSKQFDWPGTPFTVHYQQQLHDGSWVSVFDDDAEPYKEKYTYTYVLRSGDVQERYATISKRRHILGRRLLHAIGWPVHIRESIDVEFSDEVGERSGSWKGGCIGCCYELRPGETMEQSLRRMERERRFT